MKFCVSFLALLAALPLSCVLLHAQDPLPAGTSDQGVAPGQTEDNSQSTQANQTVLTGVGSLQSGALSGERDQLVPEFQAVETVESNPNNLPNQSSVSSVTRLLGTVGVERVGSVSDLKLAYVGGVQLLSNNPGGDYYRQLQQVFFDGKLRWQRTQLRLLEAFSYLPEAVFGSGAFGGTAVLGSMLGGFFSGLGTSGLSQFTPANFASFGSSPTVLNLSAVELDHRFTPRGTLTATVAYGLLHFLDSPQPNEDQALAQVAYNYALRPRDTVAAVGGYGTYEYSHLGQAFTTQFAELLWGHQFSSSLSLSGGAGPIVIDVKKSSSREVTWTASAQLQYLRPRTSLTLRYLHYINGGSGLLVGAHSDVAWFGLSRQLNRTWSAALYGAYAYSSAVDGLSVPEVSNTYSAFSRFFAGVRFARPLTQHTVLYVIYNYSRTNVEGNPYCSTPAECGRGAGQNIGGIGIGWTPQPIRLP
jgi:hypothetical protein